MCPLQQQRNHVAEYLCRGTHPGGCPKPVGHSKANRAPLQPTFFRTVIDKLVNIKNPSIHQGRNVFWKRETKVKVELSSPITINCPNCTTQQTETKVSPEEHNSDKEFTLKLLISIALTIQAFFFIAGYLGLTVFFEQYGIKTSELDMTNSAILAEGYRQTLSYLAGDDNSSIISAFFTLAPFLIISAVITYLITDRSAPWIVFMNRAGLGWAILFLLFYLPVIGLLHSIEATKKGIQEETGLHATSGLSRDQTISIQGGEKFSGQLIAADTKTTFLLSNHTVYKIDNATGRVLRQILLKEDPVKASAGD